jgi:topoisomerase IV subunit A
VLVSTRGGSGFLCQAGDLQSRNKGGRQFLVLEEGDAPLRPALFEPGMGTVVCLAGLPDRARLLAFGLDEVKVLKNGGRGVILAALDKKETLLQAVVSGPAGLVLEGIGRGGKPMSRRLTAREIAEYRVARARKGQLLEPRWKDPRLVQPREDA